MNIISSLFESIIDGAIDWIINQCEKEFRNRRKNNGEHKNAKE